MRNKISDLANLFDRGFLYRTLRFVTVGLAATLLYIALAFGVHSIGFRVEIAHIVAYVVSLLFSYIAQKRFTFRERGQHRSYGVRFFIATAGLAIIQFFLVFALDALSVPANITILASAAFYPLASFLVHMMWTFRNSRNLKGDETVASGVVSVARSDN